VKVVLIGGRAERVVSYCCAISSPTEAPGLAAVNSQCLAGADPGAIGAIALPNTYERYFFHHDFVQFRKHHSIYKAIFSCIVLSQQCCEVYFISLSVVNR